MLLSGAVWHCFYVPFKDRTVAGFLRIMRAAEQASELASVELALYREKLEMAHKKKKLRTAKKRGPKCKPRCTVCGKGASKRYRNLCTDHRL